jgi:hypothetical protein
MKTVTTDVLDDGRIAIKVGNDQIVIEPEDVKELFRQLALALPESKLRRKRQRDK